MWLILVLDVVLVVVFAVSGRASHDEALGLAGVLSTAWPFLVALVAGHTLVRAIGALVRREWKPAALWPTGIVVWLVTVTGGMVLRALTGTGTALPFIVVATVVLGASLLVPRLVVTLAVRVANRAGAARQ